MGPFCHRNPRSGSGACRADRPASRHHPRPRRAERGGSAGKIPLRPGRRESPLWRPARKRLARHAGYPQRRGNRRRPASRDARLRPLGGHRHDQGRGVSREFKIGRNRRQDGRDEPADRVRRRRDQPHPLHQRPSRRRAQNPARTRRRDAEQPARRTGQGCEGQTRADRGSRRRRQHSHAPHLRGSARKAAAGGTVYLPPNIAGFVGADHVAALVGAGLHNVTDTVVALDIGTNTELSLYHNGRHWTCSCPSGPAFEGAHIEDGMRAAPGAVERVRVEGDEVQIHTIGNVDAVGICGSGVLDTIAECKKMGLLTPKGAFTGEHPRLRGSGVNAEFVLVPAARSKTGRDVRMTRKDVNEIQLAKGAVRAGAEALLDVAGIKAEEVQQVILAGAFGTYLDLDSAIGIGMLPRTERNRYQQIGNAAGTGARRMLVSREQRQIAETLARDVEFVELAKHPNFTKIYAQALLLS
ncbi:DUF4445 domain-containing protein [Anaerolineae bacterium AMX1]|nr:DUF4445 domain-containing protein [Anaerolineae bacterium AMX1]